MDNHSVPWNAVIIIGAIGYVAGALSVALIAGFLAVWRRMRGRP